MAFTNPAVADFKNQFVRDFPYGTDPNNNVIDQDIANAQQMCNMNISQAYAADQGSYSVLYNLLTAHYLVTNLRASSQGINGQYSWLQNSKSVGSVNEAFVIPERIQNNALLASLTKTNYGQQFLLLIYPFLSGAIFTGFMPARAL